MRHEELAVIETAIQEASVRIKRQQAFIADFQSRGYDLRAPLMLLSCMLVNLRTLEKQRRDLLVRIEDVVAV
jgi:hypothetical protein